MLNSEQKVEECDATDDAGSTAVGNHIKKCKHQQQLCYHAYTL